jgi:1,4-alpha-glucan branching enzyme
LLDNPKLKYQFLAAFDRDMIALIKTYDLLLHPNLQLMHEHSDDKVIAFERAGLVFIYNFHPTRSHTDYRIHVPKNRYCLIFDSDKPEYGGYHRLQPNQRYVSPKAGKDNKSPFPIRIYLPARTGLVLSPED